MKTKEAFHIFEKDKFAAVLVGDEKTRAVRDAEKDVGWLEFRADEFYKNCPGSNLGKWLAFKTKLKKIGTFRWHKEHQRAGVRMSETKRLEIYRQMLDFVDYVDVEIKSAIAAKVVREAKSRGKKVILSYHNFPLTPEYKNLVKIYSEGKKLKPDIIKIATGAYSPDEMFSLISLARMYSGKFPLVVIPVGGSFVQRLAPLYFGSLFTYISLGTKTAPGQFSCKQLRIIRRSLL